jgi:restriction system protein
MKTPKYYEFMNPTLQALREGGGTLTNEEIVDAVVNLMQLPEEILERKQQRHNLGEVEYRIAWAKSYLKKAGYLTQSERGVWALTSKGKETDSVDERAIVTDVRKEYNARRKEKAIHQASQGVQEEEDEEASAEEEIAEELVWKHKVLETILAISPDAFERLSQHLLRECGFTQVEVTGRSGDGGIDGKGVFRLGGLIISTGTFSRDARAEAIRDGPPAIDLVDGQELAELLKRYELGVKTVMVEKIEVDVDWFTTI